MQLTVKQLLSYTRAHRAVLNTNANAVVAILGKRSEKKDELGYYMSIPATAKTRSSSTSKPKTMKTLEIRLYYPTTRAKADQYIPPALRKADYIGPKSAPPFTPNSKVWVRCNCEYFLYHCEVADSWYFNTTVEYSNGEPPKKTNPSMVPHLCKHLISAFKQIF